MNLGELFIELGVVGDVKPLIKAQNSLKESVKLIDKQITSTQRLLKYRQDLAKAVDNSEKQLIKNSFANEVRKQKLLDEQDATQKNIDGYKDMAQNIAGVVKGIGAFVASTTLAVAAINRMTDNLTRANQTWVNFTRTTDLSLRSLQKYLGVAALLDKSLGTTGAAGSIEQLNKRLFELRLTGEGARGFQLAGVNPVGQDAFGVIEQLRGRFQRMDNTSATYLMEQMGLDPKLLPLIRLTREEFEGLNNTIQNYRLSAQQREEIQAMNIQLEIAATKIRYLKDRAILAIMPAFTKFMASLARVTEGLSKIVKWLTSTNSGAITLAATIATVLIPAIKLLFATITAHPIVAVITAIIGALYLLIDDIMAYFKGGGSMFGVFLHFFDDLKKDFQDKNFSGVFDKLGDSLKALSLIPASPALLAIATAAKSAAFITGQIEKWQNGQANNIHKAMLLPENVRMAGNSIINNYDNRQINQSNSIATNQTVDTLKYELAFARNTMNAGFA